jgi:PAS domain S-box-containing protein
MSCIAREIRTAFGVDLCIVRALSADGDELRLVGGDGTGLDRLCPVYSAHVGLARLLTENCQSVRVEDAATHPDLAPRLLRRISFRSYAGIPLMVAGRLVGTLGLYTLIDRRRFTKAEIRRLENLAPLLALALAAEPEPAFRRDNAPSPIPSLSPSSYCEDKTLYPIRAEQAKDWVWEMDRDGVFTYVSPRIETALGWCPSEVYGRTLADLVTLAPTEKAEILTHWDSLRETPREFTGWKVVLRASDGRYVRIETNGVPLYDEQGRWFGYRGISREVTETPPAHDAAVEQQRIMEQVMRLTPDVLYIQNLKSQETCCLNHSFADLLGYTREEFATISPSQLALHVHPADMPRVKRYRAAQQSSWADGDYQEIEYRMRARDDQYRWLHLRETVLSRNAEGVPREIFGIAQDVTERRLIVDALTASEARLASLIANSPSAVLVVDEAERILLINQVFLDTFGIVGVADDMVGMPCALLASGAKAWFADPDAFLNRIRTVKQGRMSVTNEELTTKDGRTLERDCFPIQISGNYRGYVWLYRDITERKLAERALAEAAEKQAHIAITLQQALLRWTPLTAFPTLSVHPFYEPAFHEALLGGDFFDVFPLDERSIAVLVGDVMGKGMDAATDAAEIKFTLRAYLREGVGPNEAVRRLNRHIYRQRRWSDVLAETLVCVSVLVLDVPTGRAEIAVAGMEAPLRISPSRNRVETITVGGTPVGVMEEWLRDGPETITLAPEDILLLYTDGLTEARADDGNYRLFGPSGVCEALERTGNRHGWTDVGRLGKSLIEDAKRHAGGVLSDDLCLLLLHRGKTQ